MERYDHNLSRLAYIAGKLGRLKPICWYHTLAGDSWEITVEGGLRMSQLRKFIVCDPHVHIIAFHQKHRNIYKDDGTHIAWEDFIDEGYQYGGGDALETFTTSANNELAFIPNIPHENPSTIPLHLVKGYVDAWNHYYRIANITDELDFPTTRLHNTFHGSETQKWGLACARLPEFWNTGLTDSVYNATDYAEVAASGGAGAINLLDFAAQQGEYQSEIQRNWYDKRYRDLMKGGWGSKGVSVDADARPEILAVEEGYLSGTDLYSTDYADTGQARGVSVGPVKLHIPRKYINEHGTIWICMLVRYPELVFNEVDYLAKQTLTYENFSGDPRIGNTRPPFEINREDVSDVTDATDVHFGWHPYYQYYRTAPHAIDDVLYIDGYPFRSITDFDNDNERCYSITSREKQFFQNTADVGGGHWTYCANVKANVRRVIPPASKSIYAGAH